MFDYTFLANSRLPQPRAASFKLRCPSNPGTAVAAGAQRRDNEANYFAMSFEWFPATLDFNFTGRVLGCCLSDNPTQELTRW